MNKIYNYWDLEKGLRLEKHHAIHWKSSHRMRKNHPLCGAKCRDGHACKAKAIVNPKTDKPINGRCKNHGGKSTGAKTEEGKARCREAAKRGMLEYWKRKKLGVGIVVD